MKRNTCEVCVSLQVKPGELPLNGVEVGPQEVEQSARNGCIFCSIVVRALQKFLPPPSQPSSIFPAGSRLHLYSSYENGNALILWVNWSNLNGSVNIDDFVISRVRVELFTQQDKPSPWPIIGTCRALGNEISLETCLQHVPAWIEHCQRSHPECNVVEITPLPTRVIDIGSGFPGLQPRLFETSGKSAPYIALSHCWGKSQPITTTTANINSHLESVPWSSFPQTFKDAILLTRGLGLRYIWIDSLCIIQDSRSDWEREAALMAEVYGNSYLTIAASSSPGAHAGIFRKTNSDDATTHEIKVTPQSGHPTTVYARKRVQHMKPKEDYPLLTRAWTYQEHLLAKRVLQFSSLELVWECNVGGRCCCTASAAPSASPRDVYEKPDFTRLLHVPDDDDEEPRSRILALRKAWLLIAGRYMDRNITALSDRLPALAGVARAVHGVARSAYLAGLWRCDVVAGLLWYCTQPGVSQIRAPWRAPSWSWLSVESHVTFHSHVLGAARDDVCVEVVGAECVPAGVDAFGAVEEGAWLRLRGRVVEGVFGWDGGNMQPDYCERGGVRQMFAKDTMRVAAEPRFLYEGDRLWCLLLWCPPKDPPEDVGGSAMMLVLRKAEDRRWESISVFERVGLVVQGFPAAENWFSGVDPTDFIVL